jgi:predicted nucleotidyltransferase
MSTIDGRLATGSFAVMRATTARFTEAVRVAFDDATRRNEQVHRLTVLAFGSARRLEMTPESDLDVLILAPPDQDRARSELLASLARLDFDKPDVPPWTTLDDLSSAITLGSPESGYADALPVVIGKHAAFDQAQHDNLIGEYYSRDALRATIHFQHFFLDWRYQNAPPECGTNMKYSAGGTRDVFLIGLVYAYVRGGAFSCWPASPRIADALRFFATHWRQEYAATAEEVIAAVDLVVLCKYMCLRLVKDTPASGVTIMTPAFAGVLWSAARAECQALGVDSPRELFEAYTCSRHVIHNFRHELFRLHVLDPATLTDYEAVRSDAGRYAALPPWDRLRMIWIASQRADRNTIAAICSRGGMADDFPTIASVLLSGLAPQEFVLQVARSQARRPGMEYLNRILLRVPGVTNTILREVDDGRRLALSEAVDARYRKVLRNRLLAGRF